MPKQKTKTISKNFRFSVHFCRWLENKSKTTGIPQTRLLLNAARKQYKLKGV